MSILSNRIRESRIEKKISQTELGNHVGVGKTTISNYETGYSSPDPDTLAKISDFLGVSADYLLGRTDVRNPEEKIKEIDTLAHKEIHSVEDALEIIESQEGLMLKGEMLTDEDKVLLANALQLGMKYVLDKKQKEKE